MWQVQLVPFFVKPVSGVLVLSWVWWCLVGGEIRHPGSAGCSGFWWWAVVAVSGRRQGLV